MVVFAGLALIIVNSSGWPKVKHTFFDPAEFRAYFATIGHAFVLNIKIFLVAEVLILILALVLAVMRQLPGPVFFPIRLLAIGYTDLFRGIPTILLVLPVRVRHSRRCSCPTSRSIPSTWARPRWWSCTRRTCRRCTGPASSRCTPARRRRPGRWG